MRVCEVPGQPGEGTPRRETVERNKRWVASPPAARGGPLCAAGGPPGVPEAFGGMHRAREAALASQAGGMHPPPAPCPRRGLPGGRGRHTHLLKSKGIVPPPPPLPPGVGALQARWAAAPRGSQPAANASSGRPAPAGRPPPPTLAARLPPPGSDALRSSLGAATAPGRPFRLPVKGARGARGPGGRGGGGAGLGGSAVGVEALRGGRSTQGLARSFLRSTPVCFPSLSVWP